ncbi:MAG: hypothetical protein KDB14_28910 [Planctomycetales bacterium]|nr:hypothetical protein [Planctomycetales bacterium]
MIQLLPVIDLLAGEVVRGVGGRRDEYRAVESALCDSPAPSAVARAFAKLGYRQAYIADLDAIQGRVACSAGALEEISAAGLAMWLDAGLSSERPAWPDWLADQLAGVVIGTETASRRDLPRQLEWWGPRAVLSVDLRGGSLTGDWRGRDPLSIVTDACQLGCRRFIVLDVAAVGMARGLSTLDLCRAIRDRHPDIELTSGGGVRDRGDLQLLEDAGCDHALVASALHDGALG